MQIFEVGGCVRDEILGVPSKDIDFTVVLGDFEGYGKNAFEFMESELRSMGFEIFLSTPEFLTVRAQFPDNYFTTPAPRGSAVPVLKRGKGLTADFVLARKESDYTDGRRPDVVEPGTLFDDLARRDFTMNAIAKDTQGNLIDPHNGVQDIAEGVIRAVGSAQKRLEEDALRAVRALRFSVTKGFRIDHELMFAMQTKVVLDAIRDKISDERISDELSKMLRFDTVASLEAMHRFKGLTEAMFSGRVSLDSTLKQKGRGQ